MLQKEDAKAFDQFFYKYYKAVRLFAYKYVMDDSVAEDITEEGFINLWKKREKINDENGLKNYLYKIVYNGCLRWVERQQTKKKVYELHILNNSAPEKSFIEKMIQTETLRLVREAVHELPKECKKVFMKLYVEGKTVNETAKELNVTISTIKNQKARGIKLLRTKLTFLSPTL